MPAIVVFIVGVIGLLALSIQFAGIRHALTAEESQYWNSVNRLSGEVHKQIDALSMTNPPPPRAPANPKSHFERVISTNVPRLRAAISDIQRMNPPSLFENYHANLSLKMRLIGDFTDGISARLSSIASLLPNTRYLEDYQARRFLRHLDELLNWIDQYSMTSPGVSKTIENALQHEIKIINNALKKRSQDVSVFTAPLLEPSFFVSYSPTLIPIEISLTASGDLRLETKGSRILTPIGVFTIGSEVTVLNTNTVSIVYKDKVHLYEMEGERFAFDAPHFDGAVRIRYDGRGKLTIELRDQPAS